MAKFGLNKNVGYSNTFLLLICFVTLFDVFYSFAIVSIDEFKQVNAAQDVFDYVSYIKQVNYKNMERNAKYICFIKHPVSQTSTFLGNLYAKK